MTQTSCPAGLERWRRHVVRHCLSSLYRKERVFSVASRQGSRYYLYLLPNNPTGAAATKEQLKVWVDYSNKHGSVILFDSAYEAYITDPALPHSIYEISGAETCAIEFRSFSKTAGFTGTRCAYTVFPNTLVRGGVTLQSLWMRRQNTKYNGTAYVIQRAAEAVYSEDGRKQIKSTIAYYMNNARVITRFCKAGITATAVLTRRTSG